MTALEAKTDSSSNKILFLDDDPKAKNRNNLALDRKEAAPEKAIQTLDDQGHQKGTISPVY